LDTACFFPASAFFLHFLPAQPALTASIAFVFATVINVNSPFLGYKWFVFRTQGNYLREYRRSLLFIGQASLSSAVAMRANGLLRLVPHLQTQAPYAAGCRLRLL